MYQTAGSIFSLQRKNLFPLANLYLAGFVVVTGHFKAEIFSEVEVAALKAPAIKTKTAIAKLRRTILDSFPNEKEKI